MGTPHNQNTNFIARKLIRKGFQIVNQFQIYLTSIQFDKENNTEIIQLWTQQLFQVLRLASINNKFIKLQYTPKNPHQHLERIQSTNSEEPPAPADHATKAIDVYSELDSNKSYIVDEDSIYTRGNRQIITKKVIYSDNEEDWSSVEEKQRQDDNQNDSSYIDDSSQHTYYIESDNQDERKSMNHSMTHSVQQVQLTNEVKYVTEEIQYQIENQTRILNQSLVPNMDPDINETINQYNQYQLQLDMQSITKAQLQDIFDTREYCISIWITTINCGLYNAIKRFSQAMTSIYDNIDKDRMIEMVNMNKGQLAEHIKSKTNSAVDTPDELEGFIRLFNIEILKNVTASDKCCLSISSDYFSHLNKIEIYVKCLQKQAYFLKSDLIQLITTRCKKQIPHKDLKFSVNVKHFDTQFNFKDLGHHVQIIDQKRGKKGRPRKRKTNRNRGNERTRGRR